MKRFTVVTIVLMLTVTGWAQNKQPILGGELSNSAATSVEDIDEVMPRMKEIGLNTVLVPTYWEMMEPKEGQFDFTLIVHPWRLMVEIFDFMVSRISFSLTMVSCSSFLRSKSIWERKVSNSCCSVIVFSFSMIFGFKRETS